MKRQLPTTNAAQLGLFGDEPSGTDKAAVALPPPQPALLALAKQLPPNIRFGTSSWSFPGWRGIVWGDQHAPNAKGPYYSEAILAKRGLATYAKHPLLRAVGVDRTHYAPVASTALAAYAAAVPDDFRFLVKAHEASTLAVFPTHARYGDLRGHPSPHFLDPRYASDVVVAPFVEGLGRKASVLLFQFAAQPIEQLGGSPRKFAEQLYRFLRDLPALPHGHYAVEIRNHKLLTPDYASALRTTGAVHCFTLLPGMPAPTKQLAVVGDQPAMVIRWMLAAHHTYESALAAYGEFASLVDRDLLARREILQLLQNSVGAKPCTVIVNNKAEGSSPLSIAELAAELGANACDEMPF